MLQATMPRTDNPASRIPRSAIIAILLMACVSCGGGTDEGMGLSGDVVPLSGTLNGQAATGQMTLMLNQGTPIPNAVDYQVISFRLFSPQTRLSGTGSVNAIAVANQMTISIDAVVDPPHTSALLVGQGSVISIAPLRFTDLTMTGAGIELVLSTE
jgi:hypothetical protein